MKEMKPEKEMTKTQVFNVVILDKSGSMQSIRHAAVDGFNETLTSIKKAQEKFAGTQNHYVTLVTFCSCEIKYVLDKEPAVGVHPLVMGDYVPCCCTPLYDAMGFTLTAMRKYVCGLKDVAVVVTVITDGLENASREYTGSDIKLLVEQLKGEGWTFTYMGANQDSLEVAMNLSIRNARNFDCTDEGTRACMRKDSSTRMNFFVRLNDFKKTESMCEAPMSDQERRSCYTSMADDAFDEEESK